MLSDQGIESELSHAYLHAVASRAGFACEVSGRHLNNAAVDAVVREDGRRLDPSSVLTSFDHHVQAKATAIRPIEHAGSYSRRLPLNQYNRHEEHAGVFASRAGRPLSAHFSVPMA
ncbi:hypothetical protein OJF2_40760 [Aquisphaera giovannonii]|uniref:Uncharacterized protein n=1 Tax=Aquisphaera giovannonii TaxID=406548 RepID=A0A5B9W5Q0_9BACT|nr:hypothetical protein [Aquisphaera giovannonii]QEH35524.1 hypothetical protein OJF2_40760 [Aquisphaera giovannonii]